MPVARRLPPKAEAARVAVQTVRAHRAGSVESVVFCCFSEEDAAIHRRLIAAS